MASRVPTTLMTFGDAPWRYSVDGLAVRVLAKPYYVRGQHTNPVAVGLVPALGRADVIHCHQQHVVASSVSALLARLSGRKVFVSDLGGGGWDISAYISTDRWFHGHLHISAYSRKIAGHDGKPWAHVIYGGVDGEKFSPKGKYAATGPVLFVGRLLPHKGVDDLVEAVPPDVPLELIGQPYAPAFLARLHQLAVGKRVRFRHDCADKDLVEAYRRASCIVLPSVYRTYAGEETRVPELLGQTLLEGMACGLPAICTDVASMPEVVMHGVTGFVVPPNRPDCLREKLLWLRRHPEEARVMGEAGRRHVLERFTWGEVVQRCLEIYQAAGA